jgi:predicted N-acetyltransferase YhbS
MATWRPTTSSDITGLLRVADNVHPDLPESEAVFAERAKLFPEGSLVLVENNEVCGYIVSHPIRSRRPPELDSLLRGIAPNANQYYIHDLAILPKMRGQGLAAIGMKKILAVAKRYPTACLVSVYGTAAFWKRFGFEAGIVDEVLAEKLRGYGDDAAYLERQNLPDSFRTHDNLLPDSSTTPTK